MKDPEAALKEGIARTSVVIALKDDVRIVDCIASVDEEVEIVLALNGASDEIRRVIAEHPRRLVVTEIPDAGNLGAAYNAGAEAASGQYLLYMDSDCVFAPGVIRMMVRAVLDHPVVKGQVVYGESDRLLSRLTARVREFDEGDYVSALSPPLVYDRRVADCIGGYHYDPLVHWCEDREFDFRLQLAEIPVVHLPDAVIHHDAQHGLQNLRSYWRYGIGEGIGQQLGIFTTPAIPVAWRVYDSARTLVGCARDKGPLAAALYALMQSAFHTGTVYHLLRDPFQVRGRLPAHARRTRMLRSVPEHCPKLTAEQREKLRQAHRERGRVIEPVKDLSVFRVPAPEPSLVQRQ
ncbi:glycosyltransferase family 2 protein [Streptomyces olivoreticuli]|uniref:glycosyltransferase n=1 Tax=Streptomyces olivoreticuli TaxID=68246 RepID=UPI000E25E240|nr:glycosyltransferase family 2 protein [Streptomyces olivoreticuli]